MRASAAALFLCLAAPAFAQQTGAIPPAGEQAVADAVRMASARAEYEQVLHQIQLSDWRSAQLSAEIAMLKKDDASLTTALIQSAKTEKKLSENVDAITARLAPLKEQEAEIHASLLARSDVLADVLGALQRMGLNPPPAILVSPDDALSSVRSAILLGAVVPEMRQETEALANSLDELKNVAQSIQAERDRLAAAVAEQVTERQRLTILQGEKEKLRSQHAADVAAEAKKIEVLAGKAGNLKDLIAAIELETQRADARTAAARAREDALAAAPVPQQNQLLGGLPFSSLKGQLELPVAGRIAGKFSDKRKPGAMFQGDMVATQSAAIVTAPTDGKILYAGQFRSFGQLLILDVGNDYLIVMAGLGRTSVAAGQTVLSGEPVGAMGEHRLASANQSDNAGATTELYVEFRMNGKPIDPAPWWAKKGSGRT